VGDATVVAIAAAVKTNATLQSFDLDASDVRTTDAAEVAILDCIQANVTLQSLKLFMRSQDHQRRTRIINECVARNRCLVESVRAIMQLTPIEESDGFHSLRERAFRMHVMQYFIPNISAAQACRSIPTRAASIDVPQQAEGPQPEVEQEVKLQLALQMNEADALERESMDVARAIMLSLARPSSGSSPTAKSSRPSSAAGNASTTSAVSTVGPKCFLPNNVFKTMDGGLVLSQDLRVGTCVTTSDGGHACVTDWRPYPRNDMPNKLVEIVTHHARIKVSAKHRVVVPTSDGEDEPRFASALRAGDHVRVGAKRQRVSRSIATEERCDLFMVSFEPDVPVEVFNMPVEGVQTRGEPQAGGVYAAELLQIVDADGPGDIDESYEEVEEENDSSDDVMLETAGPRRRRRSGRSRARKAQYWSNVRGRTPSPSGQVGSSHSYV